MIKKILYIAIIALITGSTICFEEKITILRGETIVRSIGELFPPQADKKSTPNAATPYKTDSPAASYFEWGEARFGGLPGDLRDCLQPNWLEGGAEDEVLVTALCQGKTLAVLTYNLGNHTFTESNAYTPSKAGVTGEIYTTGGGYRFLVGYGQDSKLDLTVFPETGPDVTLPVDVSQYEFTEGLGIAYVEYGNTTSQSSLEDGLGQAPGVNKFVLSFEKTKFEDRKVQTNTLAVTKINETDLVSSQTTYLQLGKQTGFLVNSPRVFDLEMQGTELRMTFSDNDPTSNTRYAVCQTSLDTSGDSPTIKLNGCKEVSDVPTLPNQAYYKIRTFDSINWLAVAGDAPEGDIKEVGVCQIDMSTLKASACVYNNRTMNEARKRAEVQNVYFTRHGEVVVTYRERGSKTDVSLQLIHDITIDKENQVLTFHPLLDGHAQAFLSPEKGMAVAFRTVTYSAYAKDPTNGVITISGSEITGSSESILVTEVASSRRATFFVEVADKLTDNVKVRDLKKVPSLILFPDQTTLLPITRDSLTGNALSVEVTSPNPKCHHLISNLEDASYELNGLPEGTFALDIQFSSGSDAFVLVKKNATEQVDAYYAACVSQLRSTNCTIDINSKELLDKDAQIYRVQAARNPKYPGIVGTFKGSSSVSFLFYNTVTKKISSFGFSQDVDQIDGLFFFQAKGGDALLMMALPKQHVVRAYRATAMDFSTARGSTPIEIKVGTPGIPDARSFCPRYIDVCSHSDSFLEIGSNCEGDARIFKWVFSDETNPIFKAAVPMNDVYLLEGGEDILFCPAGDEFAIYDKKLGKVYGTSTQVDASFFLYYPEQIGIEKVTDFACIRSLSSFVIIGTNQEGTKKYVATYFGNMGESANSRVHSVFEVPVYARVTSSPAEGGINKVNHLIEAEGQEPMIKRVYLGGPLIHVSGIKGENCTQYNVKVTNPEGKSAELDYNKITIDQPINEIKVTNKTTRDIQEGFNSFSQLVDVQGHVFETSLNFNGSEAHNPNVTFAPRFKRLPDPTPSVRNSRRLLNKNIKNLKEDEQGLKFKNWKGDGERLAFWYHNEDGNTVIHVYQKPGQSKRIWEFNQFTQDFDAVFDDQGVYVTLGAYDGHGYTVHVEYIPFDGRDTTTALSEPSPKIDNVLVHLIRPKNIVVGVWTKYSNAVFLTGVEMKEAHRGQTLKTEDLGTVRGGKYFLLNFS